jgi:hypothetical protein
VRQHFFTIPVKLAAYAALVATWIGIPLACAQSGPAPKTAEQAYKNIQVLKAVPADQLIPSMQFITASLGVECEYCHVAGAFDKDDKKPKQVARKMMEMMSAINKNNFDGEREVTCYSCHRGKPNPEAIPAIQETVAPPPHAASEKPSEGANDAAGKDQAQASADPVIEKYLAALGGADAIRKVTSRTEKGSADLAGKQIPIDLYLQAPDKRLSVMHLPNGDSITAYNGSRGWLSVPGRPTHWMSQPEAEVSQLDADLYLPVRLKQIFTELHLAGQESINGQKTTVVVGTRANKPPVKFYFDQQTGLLVRMLRYADTPLGLNPSQVDYSDYRPVDGVKSPYKWSISRPSGRFTIQLDEIRQNVPVDAARFEAPPQ